MSALLTWPVLVTLAAGFGTLALISYLFQYRHKPGAKWFILTLLGQSTFCFAYGIGLTVFIRPVRMALEIVALIGLAWLGVPFLGFALGYTGRGKVLRSRWFKLLLSFPVLTTLLLPLNSWHHLVWNDFSVDPSLGVATASYTFQPLGFVGILGAGITVAVAAFILFDTVLSYGPLYRKEALAVALSPVPPIVGLFPWLFGFGPFPTLNTIAIGLFPHVLLDAYAFVGSGMFEFYPATNRAAERSTIDDLQSPVVILEEEGRIVDVNDAAATIFGIDKDQVVTEPLSAVVETDIDLSPGTAGDSSRLSVRHEGRQLEFRVERSLLTDSSGNHVGYTLLFQDITEAVQREQRLSVLNRVLRHNLRNDLSVVEGFVSESARRIDDDEVSSMLDRAQSKITDLVAAGETARDIEETIGLSALSPTTVTLPEFLDRLASDIGQQYPDATVTVDCHVDTIETDERVLASVLSELLENAVVHSPDAAVVVLSASQRDSTVEVTVSDEGPGIPYHEVETLEQGEETALEHGSGLGLWLVKWGVLRLGGDLSFETDEEGTTATVTLPASGEADQTSSPSA